jgi:hypothetical protein
MAWENPEKHVKIIGKEMVASGDMKSSIPKPLNSELMHTFFFWFPDKYPTFPLISVPFCGGQNESFAVDTTIPH